MTDVTDTAAALAAKAVQGQKFEVADNLLPVVPASTPEGPNAHSGKTAKDDERAIFGRG